MSDQHDGPHDTRGPLAVPRGGHFPAGWVSPASADRADRERITQEIAREEEEAAHTAREREVDRRLAGRRGQVAEPEQAEPGGSSEPAGSVEPEPAE
jgi:hypothetical protein